MTRFHSMPAHFSVVKTCHSIPLNRLATKCCEKSGLETRSALQNGAHNSNFLSENPSFLLTGNDSIEGAKNSLSSFVR